MKKVYNFVYWNRDGSNDSIEFEYALTDEEYKLLHDTVSLSEKDIMSYQNIDDITSKIYEYILELETEIYAENEELVELLFDYDEDVDYESLERDEIKEQLKDVHDYGIKLVD